MTSMENHRPMVWISPPSKTRKDMEKSQGLGRVIIMQTHHHATTRYRSTKTNLHVYTCRGLSFLRAPTNKQKRQRCSAYFVLYCTRVGESRSVSRCPLHIYTHGLFGSTYDINNRQARVLSIYSGQTRWVRRAWTAAAVSASTSCFQCSARRTAAAEPCGIGIRDST